MLRVAAVLLCALVVPLRAQSRNWRPEDRVLITAFHEVGALASDTRALYVATRGGLLRFDFLRGAWDLPTTEEDGYPAHDQPTALAVDAMQMDVWLGTASGALFRYRSVPPRWENISFALGGEVLAIVPSAGVEEEGIWVQTRAGWYRAGRIAMSVTPVAPARVPAGVLQRAGAQRTLDPSLSAFRSTLGLDARARRWPITSFARGDRTEQYWFGTNGNFLVRFDALRAQPEWYWYGAASRGVSALALVGDTLWLGSDGRGQRSGVARGTLDLQSWQLSDPLTGGPSGRIDQIVSTNSHVYLAGSDGLTRIERNTGRMQRLSSERAGSVAVAGEHVYLSSARTSALLHIAPTGERSTVGPAGNRVRVLDGRVWVASQRGVFNARAEVHPDSTTFVLEQGLPVSSYLDVAQVGHRFFALAADALFVRDSSGWSAPMRVPALRGLGRLSALAPDGNALWVGGVNGLGRYQPETGEWLYFLAPRDVPAGPIDIMPQGAYIWLATPAGALRLSWRQ